MSIADMLSYPSDMQYPIPKKYNSADYAGLQNSSLLNALQQQATQQGQGQATNISRVPQGQQAANNAGYYNDLAKSQVAGALQPWDERQKMGQWEQQNAMNQAIWNLQNQANIAQQQAFGQLLGTGLGAGLGYMKNNSFQNALNQQQLGMDAASGYGQTRSMMYAPMVAWSGPNMGRSYFDANGNYIGG